MSNQFHIIPKKLTGKEKYDPVNNNLVLPEAGYFAVTIKELEDLLQKKPVMPLQINELSDKEFDSLPDTKKKAYTTKVKNHNKEIAQYNNELQGYETSLKPYKNLNWAWCIAGIKLDPEKIDHNETFTKGIQEILDFGQKKIHFPKLLEGGGIAWLEVWPDNEKSTAKIGTGMCVQAEGKPAILKTEWTDFDYNPLDQVKIAFMSEVILHVYTTAMYGQEIEIHLIDKDIFDPNDELDIADKKYFTRQIDLLKIKQSDSHKKIVTDLLVKTEQNNDDDIADAEQYVQKIEIKVLIEDGWKDKAGKTLKIFPAIKSLQTKTYFKGFKREYLNVSNEADSEKRQVVAEITNKPLLYGTVETNVADFLPCRFDTVKLDGKEVFSSANIHHRNKSTIDIEIVAGKKELHLLDFAFRTLECEHTPEKHINKELSVITVPQNFTLNVGAGANARHPAKEEQEKAIKIKTAASHKLTYAGGLETTAGEENKKETGDILVRQDQIQFDAFFNYDIPLNSLARYVKVAKYFWLGESFTKSAEILKIRALANTCAFKKDINIAIYPDIKWSLVFGFNVESEQLENLLPNWDQEKTIDRYKWDGNKFTEKLQGKLKDAKSEEEKKKINDKIEQLNKRKEANQKVNDKMLDIYKQNYGTPAENTEQPESVPTAQKGKLATLLEIMKKVDISIKAEIYGDTKLELTRDFVENTVALAKQYKDVYEKVKWAMELLKGEKDTPENKADGDNQFGSLLKDKLSRSRIEGLEEALTRSTQEVEILFPQFSIGGNWQFEPVDGKKYPELAGRSGLGYTVAFAAAPLIGIEIRWHILDLICRRHPIAYAILAAVKTLLAALGDNKNAIVVDFWVQGQISTDINFTGNALAGDKKITAKGDAHITAGVQISINIKGEIISGKYTALAEVGVGGTGEVGLGIIGNLGIDDQGIWMQSSLAFDGIKLTFTAVIKGEIKKKRVKKDGTIETVKIAGGESKIEIEITMLEHTFESDKFYLN